MTLAGIRVLKVAVVVVPVAAVFLLLHIAGPGLRRDHRAGTLPEGYGFLGSFGPYDLYARPDNGPARLAGAVLEDFRRAVFEEFGEALGLRMPTSRFDVIVFSDQEDLVEYAKGHLGSDFARNAGFYIGSWRAMGVVGRGSVAEIVRPLFHEGTHMLLDTCVEGSGHEWSRWLNEGLATYLEASDIREDGSIECGGVDGSLLREVRIAIASGAFIPLRRLLAAESEDFEGDRNLLFYGQASLLVHYLMEADGAPRGRFLDYLKTERHPGPVSDLEFERSFGALEAVEAGLRAHITDLVSR